MQQIKLLKTIRLDQSDVQVYEQAAEAGEWAIVGTFTFWDMALETLNHQQRQAFNNGFLGTESFGWSTLVAVADISAEQYQQVIHRVAEHLVQYFGAPTLPAALPAAREEVEFSAGLCEHPINTLLMIQRSFAGDEIKEDFKVVHPQSAARHEGVQLWGIDDSMINTDN